MRSILRVVGRKRIMTLLAGVGLVAGTVAAQAAVQSGPAPRHGNLIKAGQAQGVERVSLIVHLDENADRGPVRAFAGNNGGYVMYEYKVVLPNAMNLRDIPVTAIQGLSNIPGVNRIERDEYHADLVKLDDATPLVNGLQSQISGAGFSADGSGIRVCICDTGIDTDHIMYADRIDFAASYDFNNNDPDPEDDHGHGSHVSGIAVGGTGLNVDFGCPGPEPFQGMAPAATLIGAKILNQFGGGLDSNIIAGIDHCADQSASGGQADVINLSIGTGNFAGTCDSHSWAVAANNAVANGVVVVAASGNECNSNSMGSPACGTNVIAVGATWKDDYPNCGDSTSSFNWGCAVDISPAVDDVVGFSNQSDLLDVAAPGAMIWSASNSPGGTSITTQAGTSMASPMVAGLAAVILSADPSLTPAEVRQIIRDGSVDLGPAGFDRGYGYGRIDAIGSLSLVTPCTTNGDCDDGLFCNGAETCSGGSCQAGSDPCPGEGCDEVNDVCVPLVCNDDGTCDAGEDCNNCPNDCFSGSGASCGNGVCEVADGEDCVNCPSDCNGKQNGNPNGRFCCGNGGDNPVGCADSACTSGGFACTETPAVGSCCGDGTCEGSEDTNNCAVDCAVTCSVPADCDDGVACTDDDCVGGTCVNTANDANCPDDGLFCNGTEFCDAVAGCSSTGDPCAGNETCNETTDTCDQPTCGGNKAPCSVNADCCSLNCKNGTCKGN